jgi:predicted nucleic acid-binding protein
LVVPLRTANAARLADFARFFGDPLLQSLAISTTVWDRAARIRAAHGFGPLDSLHLAAAVEHNCGLFLTADARLAKFPDIPVEVIS